MQLGPKFVTIDEFNNYWTMNLRDMLRTSANPSNQAEKRLQGMPKKRLCP